ncbi:hypothetical protein NMY22_g15494 [Coprinellus aureogranulatus]|nr:hypothetical protein NMY22_g15494 [Coprinellus aureogranulatus]
MFEALSERAPEPSSTHFTTSSGEILSGRAPVPSTRAEQLNSIGTNVIKHAPVIIEPQNDGPPDWFGPACTFLKAEGRLGEEWGMLIEKWIELEMEMGYGRVAKGALPVPGRPEEWKDWTAKKVRGVRPYDKPPFMLEPAEFGKTFTKWWSSIQPPFRLSEGAFPKQVYSDATVAGDPWAPVRKSGPNGFISVVTMMRWWGIEALFPSNIFKTDSRQEWHYLVYDVRMCLEEMLKAVPKIGAKRKRAVGDLAGKENKHQA